MGRIQQAHAFQAEPIARRKAVFAAAELVESAIEVIAPVIRSRLTGGGEFRRVLIEERIVVRGRLRRRLHAIQAGQRRCGIGAGENDVQWNGAAEA